MATASVTFPSSSHAKLGRAAAFTLDTLATFRITRAVGDTMQSLCRITDAGAPTASPYRDGAPAVDRELALIGKLDLPSTSSRVGHRAVLPR